MTIYLNGEYVPEEKATVSVFDHGLLYGDGVFEGIRCYNGRVFKFDEHIKRLYDSAKAIMLNIPLNRAEMEQVVLETCRRNSLRDGYVRLVVTRGAGDLGLGPEKCVAPTVFCIAGKISLYPRKYYEEGLEVITVPTRRNIVEAINPRIKSLNYLNNILAKIEGQIAGVPEAIMLNQEGYVVECTADNIFIVRDRALLTPPSYAGALEGITRNTVLELAGPLGIPAREALFTRYEVYTADECFLTGTGAEIVPVVQVDRRIVGLGVPGTVTQKLTAAFHALTQGSGTPIYLET